MSSTAARRAAPAESSCHMRSARNRRLLSAATIVGTILATAVCPSFTVTASAAPATPATGNSTGTVTTQQALAAARSGGRSVPVTAATTATDTLTANPEGTLTLTRT